MRTPAQLAAAVAASAILLMLAPQAAPPVSAAWSAGATGHGRGAATTMPNGTQPVGTATGSSVTVRWAAATLGNGTPVAGYVVNRYDALNGAAATVAPGCSGVLATTTCTEQSVPAGTWVYTDTPVQLNWIGGASPASAPIAVT
jgi:hypothetical protein